MGLCCSRRSVPSLVLFASSCTTSPTPAQPAVARPPIELCYRELRLDAASDLHIAPDERVFVLPPDGVSPYASGSGSAPAYAVFIDVLRASGVRDGAIVSHDDAERTRALRERARVVMQWRPADEPIPAVRAADAGADVVVAFRAGIMELRGTADYRQRPIDLERARCSFSAQVFDLRSGARRADIVRGGPARRADPTTRPAQ